MKRLPLLLLIVVLLSLVAGSVSASPVASPPASEVNDGGEWSNVCHSSNQFSVYVVSENVLRYTCTNVVKVWSKTCDQKAVLGYTDTLNRGGGVSVTCGV